MGEISATRGEGSWRGLAPHKISNYNYLRIFKLINLNKYIFFFCHISVILVQLKNTKKKVKITTLFYLQ